MMEKENDRRPRVVISVDVDPLSHYVRCRGWDFAPGTNPNAVYEDGLPRFLEIFREFGIKATFFIVGRDVLDRENAGIIGRMAEEGHEIANHTMQHRLDLLSLSEAECEEEIANAERTIFDNTGIKTAGFRAPGWNISPTMLHILERRGYAYDSSVMPGPWIPLMKAANRVMNRNRATINFAGQRAFPPAPDTPYFPDPRDPMKKGGCKILEIPAGVSPGFRLPFYGTSRFALGETFFNMALSSIPKNTGAATFVFHALELVDYHRHINDPRLRVKPGIDMDVSEKERIVRDTIKHLLKRFDSCRMIDLPSNALRE